MRSVLITCTIYLLLVGHVCSQTISTKASDIDWEWAPIGAVWMYSTVMMEYDNPPFDDDWEYYWYIRSEKDTVINQQVCRKLSVVTYYPENQNVVQMPNRYTYEESGKVYLYSAIDEEFQIIYDYSAEAGDTIRLYSPIMGHQCYVDYLVDSTVNRPPGTWPENYPAFETNNTIRSYHLSVLVQSCSAYLYTNAYVGNYLEYSGASGTDMCPIFEIGEEEIPQFNCYYDGINSIGSLRYESCDSCESYYYKFLDVENETLDVNVNLYPNPVSETLVVEGFGNVQGRFNIFSLSGVLIYQSEFETGDFQIDLSGFRSGMYMLLIETRNDIIRKQFVKS